MMRNKLFCPDLWRKLKDNIRSKYSKMHLIQEHAGVISSFYCCVTGSYPHSLTENITPIISDTPYCYLISCLCQRSPKATLNLAEEIKVYLVCAERMNFVLYIIAKL